VWDKEKLKDGPKEGSVDDPKDEESSEGHMESKTEWHNCAICPINWYLYTCISSYNWGKLNFKATMIKDCASPRQRINKKYNPLPRYS
jgi:hypothetical protein